MKNIILILIGLIALNFQIEAQTVKDIDGNVYNTVIIGTQVWMKENLKTTKYNDGMPIPLIADGYEWGAINKPAYCVYSPNNLYNWYAVNTGKLCPIGWHVPTDKEWTTLINYLGGKDIAGGKMKETGTSHWQNPNTGATNSSGFTALPTGERICTSTGTPGICFGSFVFKGTGAFFWSSTAYSAEIALYRGISNDYEGVYQQGSYSGYMIGFSVRCLKDTIITQVENIENGNKIKLFPNPSTDRITVGYTGKINNIYIFNLLGELVSQRKLPIGTNEIDISNLKKGIYIIKIENSTGIIQQKLIKE